MFEANWSKAKRINTDLGTALVVFRVRAFQETSHQVLLNGESYEVRIHDERGFVCEPADANLAAALRGAVREFLRQEYQEYLTWHEANKRLFDGIPAQPPTAAMAY